MQFFTEEGTNNVFYTKRKLSSTLRASGQKLWFELLVMAQRNIFWSVSFTSYLFRLSNNLSMNSKKSAVFAPEAGRLFLSKKKLSVNYSYYNK